MRVSGTLELLVNGENYSADGDFKLDFGGVKAEEAKVDLSGNVVGSVQSVHANKIEGEIFLKDGQRARDFVKFKGARVVIKTPNATYVQPDAWDASSGELDLKNDKLPFLSMGSDLKEL